MAWKILSMRSALTKQISSPVFTKSINYSSNANVLGIETSCDDTGCAIVNHEGTILGESLYSQNSLHIRYGGVNPLIAHELHSRNIENAVSEALQHAGLKINEIDVIAVTAKPGMLINLQVGVKYANYLARINNKPLIPIHHMEAHALVVRLFEKIALPYLVLLISGGHCLLAVVRDINDFLLLGECLDNPPGEVLDKVARRMKLKNIPKYSELAGGKAIEMAALKATSLDSFKFPLPLARYRDCNFSFSGLKDFLERTLIMKEKEHRIIGDGIIPEVNELCASFQLAVAEHITHRIERGMIFCEKRNLIPNYSKTLVLSGGVACNDFIYKSVSLIGKKMGYNVVRPPPRLCTDNGVMIAWNGVEILKKHCKLVSKIRNGDIMPIAPLGLSLIEEVKELSIPVKVTRLKKYMN